MAEVWDTHMSVRMVMANEEPVIRCLEQTDNYESRIRLEGCWRLPRLTQAYIFSLNGGVGLHDALNVGAEPLLRSRELLHIAILSGLCTEMSGYMTST